MTRRSRALTMGLSVLVGALVAGSAAAYAETLPRGHAVLIVPAAEVAALVVSGVHLAHPPAPGETADLVFTVHNRSASAVTVDRVTAELPLSNARPAGCTKTLSGPLLSRTGFRLAGKQRVVLAPQQELQVTVPRVLRLSAAAKTGCGFHVGLNVQTVPAPPS